MSEETTNEASVEEKKGGFKFPTAYTVLFLLLILVVIATWIIPAGQYDTERRWRTHSRQLPSRLSKILKRSLPTA